jgi:hypothetical protein
VTSLFIRNGLPQKLRFDNDTRFVGNWLSDRFPSPLMQFLLCLGVEPDLVEPGKPQHKPFAERSVRTLKHECLRVDRPENWVEAGDFLDLYRYFYNHERANQSLACGNRPPYEAFPQLPVLPHLPQTVDPDRWLDYYHNQVFRRRADQSGRVTVGHHDYRVGKRYARQRVGVLLDAKQRVFQLLVGGTIVAQHEIRDLIGHPMAFEDYLKRMLEQTRRSRDSKR